jgi:predicted Zn finger-like uncharacterized protein
VGISRPVHIREEREHSREQIEACCVRFAWLDASGRTDWSIALTSRNLDDTDIKTSALVFIIFRSDACFERNVAKPIVSPLASYPATSPAELRAIPCPAVLPMELPITLNCPHCDANLRVKDESLLGSRVKCPKCGERLTVEEPLEVVEESAILDDDRDGARQLPPLRKSSNGPKPVDKKSTSTKTFLPPTYLGSGGGRKLNQRTLRISLAGAEIGLIACVIVAGILLVRAGSEPSAKFQPPETYVPIHAGSLPLTGVIPEGWKENYGGGVVGPMRASFSDGASISIEIRQTVGISFTIAQVISRKRVQPPSLSQLHDHHRKMIMPDFRHFHDGSARPIEIEGFPEACVSTFTAGKRGIFGGEVKGCRATLRCPERQFNVVCTCKPTQFDDVLPVFEKIIASLGTREEKKKK